MPFTTDILKGAAADNPSGRSTANGNVSVRNQDNTKCFAQMHFRAICVDVPDDVLRDLVFINIHSTRCRISSGRVRVVLFRYLNIKAVYSDVFRLFEIENQHLIRSLPNRNFSRATYAACNRIRIDIDCDTIVKSSSINYIACRYIGCGLIHHCIGHTLSMCNNRINYARYRFRRNIIYIYFPVFLNFDSIWSIDFR